MQHAYWLFRTVTNLHTCNFISTFQHTCVCSRSRSWGMHVQQCGTVHTKTKADKFKCHRTQFGSCSSDQLLSNWTLYTSQWRPMNKTTRHEIKRHTQAHFVYLRFLPLIRKRPKVVLVSTRDYETILQSILWRLVFLKIFVVVQILISAWQLWRHACQNVNSYEWVVLTWRGSVDVDPLSEWKRSWSSETERRQNNNLNVLRTLTQENHNSKRKQSSWRSGPWSRKRWKEPWQAR